MADVFISSLAIGLVLLAAMLLVFNTSWPAHGFASANNWFAPAQGSQPELVAAELGQSHQVGEVITEETAEFGLGGFDISGIAQQEALPGGIVQSGLLFGDQSLRYTIDNLQTVRFTITRTNGYAPLVIKANGQVVKEIEAELGTYVIPIELTGNVKLEISVASSGWKIWAPALYDISNVVAYSVHPAVQYNFARGEDFVRGELRINFGSRQGSLTAYLNDKEVWSGTPGTVKVIAFDDIEDANTLTLESDSGSQFSGTANLLLYYEHVETKTYETTFNLTSEQLDMLPGHIIFEVPSVQHAGTIVVKLVSGDQTKLAEAIDADVGMNAVAFYKSNVVPGKLTKLVIESPDALFYIRNLKVWV